MEVAKDAIASGLFVFWLVFSGFGSGTGVSVVPVPYFDKQSCLDATEALKGDIPWGRGQVLVSCVPQPIEDVADYLAAQSGRNAE